MSGAPDLLYVRARAVLLDAAEALAEQLDAVVLVGAQAVYLHTGDADFVAGVPHTTDADFCVAPADLRETPLLSKLLTTRQFTAGDQPGAWLSPDGIRVDLMVPEALAGAGSRGARLGLHGKRVARRAKGLEGALVDRECMEIVSLECDDDRSVVMSVAGPAALLVAKVHKIAERTTGAGDRVRDKDALDVLRLLQGPLTQRRSRHGWWTLPTTRLARRSRPKRCPSSRCCLVAKKRRASSWRSARPAPTPKPT